MSTGVRPPLPRPPATSASWPPPAPRGPDPREVSPRPTTFPVPRRSRPCPDLSPVRDGFDWFYRQVVGVLDPLAVSCYGLPESEVRRRLARAWRQEYGTTLRGPVLTECATALRTGTPWRRALWSDGW